MEKTPTSTEWMEQIPDDIWMEICNVGIADLFYKIQNRINGDAFNKLMHDRKIHGVKK